MRFAAVARSPQSAPQPQRSWAAELMRRLLVGELQAGRAPAAGRPQEVPADLDQRVRLVGEW
jgi:hypothetical protein